MDAIQSCLQEAVSEATLAAALRSADQLRSGQAVGSTGSHAAEFSELESVLDILVMQVHSFLGDDTNAALLRSSAANSFQLARALPGPQEPLEQATWLVEMGCYATLGDRSADFSRQLADPVMPANLLAAEDWGARVRAISLAMWLHLLRRSSRDDLDAAKALFLDMLKSKDQAEGHYLKNAKRQKKRIPAASLIVYYNHCDAADILSDYLTNGSADAGFDIRESLKMHFQQASCAAHVVRLFDAFNTNRLLARTAQEIVTSELSSRAQIRRREKLLAASALETQAGKHHA